jgi:DNA-binding NarL/FixJ family response regulator
MSGCPRAVVAMTLPVHREAIATGLRGHADVVGEAGAVEDALSLLRDAGADVLVAELRLGGEGANLCEAVKADGGLDGVRVIVLGGPRSGEDELVAAVHSGADGFVSEDDGLDALRHAVDRVGRGEASIPGAMLGSLLRTLIRDRREEDRAVERFSRLSMREREVVMLIADGLDNAAIGERMYVSTNTARTHVQNILRKLEVSSRLEAASMVNTFGLLERFPVEGEDR